MSTQTNETPMKRCTRCGETKPATAEYFTRKSDGKYGLCAHCKVCNRIVKANYRLANREKLKVSKAVYRAKNKDKIKAHRAALNAANKQRISEYNARYYAEHKPQTSAHNATYYKAHADKLKSARALYAINNPDKVLAFSRHRRNIKRGLPATFTAIDWTRCLEYWEYRCAYCGRPRGLWHTLAQDHYVPLSRGGPYTPDNILPACHGDGGCNNSKTNRNAHEWLVCKFSARKAARIERRIAEYFASLEAVAS